DLYDKFRVYEAMPLILDFIKRANYWKAADNLAGVSLVPLCQSGKYKFIGGPLRVGTAYAAHPMLENKYINISSFHRYLLDEKRANFVKLCVALGSTRVELQEDRGATQALSIGLDLPPESPFSANVSADARSGSSFRLDMSLEGHNNPRVPDDLCWMAA